MASEFPEEFVVVERPVMNRMLLSFCACEQNTLIVVSIVNDEVSQ